MSEATLIQLNLSVPEINTILRCLGKHPFDEINGLIQNIKIQGDTQLAALETAEANVA